MDITEIDRECLLQPCSYMNVDNWDNDLDDGNLEEDGLEDEQNGLEEQLEDEPTITPEEGMLFSTEDQAYKFYNHYAFKMGFSVRKSSTNASKTDKLKTVGRLFVCSKQGKRKTEGSSSIGGSHIRELRMGCNASMRIRLTTETEMWKVTSFDAAHNHEMSTPSKASKHRSHKRVHRQIVVKDLITKFHEEGMSNAKIARAVNSFEPDETQIITSQQVHDHLRVEKKNNLGKSCAMVVKHFQNKKSIDPGFYFNIEVADDYTLRSVFWADRRSQETYKKFSDVVVFDVTYRTNNFSLPFAPFTGINHHRQSTLLGCALLADEKESTFVWLFEQWLMCMGGKEPAVIITDQDAAMGNAIARVFPNTLHRWCDWHLEKNIAENLVNLKLSHGEDIELDFEKIRSSESIDEAENCWNELITKHDLREKSWLPKLWERRKSWLHCYLKDTFVAGTRSSQRSESMNSFFDTYVNAMTPLHEFVVQYDKALNSRRRAEEDADFKTMNTKPVATLGWSLEVQAGNVYTAEVYKLVREQMVDALKYFDEKVKKEGSIIEYRVGLQGKEKERGSTVIYDSDGVLVSCSCKLFETHGWLCGHALWILRKKRIPKIPDRYILKRWTIECRHQAVDVEFRKQEKPVVVDREKKYGVFVTK